MTHVTRFSISCPKCGKEVAAAWEDAEAVYTKLPDSFPCKDCGAVISLTEEQRQIKRIKLEAMRKTRWPFFASWILGTIVMFMVIEQPEFQFRAIHILAALAVGFIFGGLVAWIGEEIVKAKVRKRIAAQQKSGQG